MFFLLLGHNLHVMYVTHVTNILTQLNDTVCVVKGEKRNMLEEAMRYDGSGIHNWTRNVQFSGTGPRSN